MYLKLEEQIDSERSDKYTKLFTNSYFNDITQFRKEFSEKVEDNKALIKPRTKVFGYLVGKEWNKKIVLSRNIIDHAIHYNRKIK